MTQVTRFWPILTGTHRYDKSLSTRNCGRGTLIEAPILAYLIETRNGRILYDVGCDYRKLSDPGLRSHYYESEAFPFGPPEMSEEQRLPNRLRQLGLNPGDVDVVFVGHLHFDHAGGLCEMEHAEIHLHEREWQAAHGPADEAYFASDFSGDYDWRMTDQEYTVTGGVEALETPGHTAGHMSLFIELPKGSPILLSGDAADLRENIDQEIAPGLCWHDREDLALESIRKLKRIARETGAWLWPNHDMEFYRRLKPFPGCYE